MHRVDRKNLEGALFVQIKTMKIGKSRGGKHPIEELRDDSTIRELVKRMVDQVDCESRFVVSTGPHPIRSVGPYNPLVWGVDEPWPEGCEPEAGILPPRKRARI